MIFEHAPEDTRYRRWFAWFPVVLSGPDEWDRAKRLRTRPRVVWLRNVWRFRTRPSSYYALPDAHSRNALLRDSVEGWPTSFEAPRRDRP